MDKKPSKWDFKKALRMIGVDPNEGNIEKLKLIDELNIPKDTAYDIVDDDQETESTNDLVNERVTFGIIEENNHFKVLKVPFALTDAQVCGTYDSEARAILERGKLEAEHRRLEFKRKQQ